MSQPASTKHRVVVIGGGFGGLQTAQRLKNTDTDVTLIDRRNFHLFQPLTYQVATGGLSPGEVAYPLRALFKTAPNVRVMLAEVSGFDLDERYVQLRPVTGVPCPDSVQYDTLVIAAGSSYSYFGHEEWREKAFEVKTLESALNVRSRILTAFETAELTTDADERNAELTFVVVGGGPTGVEVAGQIAELARDTLPRDFRRIDSRQARVLLIEAGDRLLPTFPPRLSEKASRALLRLGVTPRVNQMVVGVDDGSVTVKEPGDFTETIRTATVIWAAGVTASGLAEQLGEASGAEVDKLGRVTVEPDLTLPGHSEVLVLGDMVRVRDGRGGFQDLPGVAPVAIQQGHYAAKQIIERTQGRAARPFRYLDKGNLATIGRGSAVADLHLLKLSGRPAWLVWLFVHIYYLIGFQNRIFVLMEWSLNFFTHGRGARLITRRD
ncbi:MAG TPA: NAD(P)/FAD-dependent oxidoreductase [Solirubrobacteraceae bacterium]|jgi:NADH dehydrogenase